MSVYFTKIIPRKALWGGTALRKAFGFPPDFGDDIGQAWAFSAQRDNASILMGGGYTGRSLLDLWNEQPAVFKSRYAFFPFIISLVAPQADLSIQVHPGDAQARKAGYPCGKNEAWFFLDAKEGASIAYGHSAADESDLRRYIGQGRWHDLVRRMPVKKGDTVYIPAGALHALCADSVVYEIQQSADVTYRLYDYGRLDAAGQPRPLQIEEAIACLRYDNVETQARPAPVTIRHPRMEENVLVRNDSFVVRKLICKDRCALDFSGYMLCTVAEGAGCIQGNNTKKGDSFLIPAGEKPEIEGNLTLLTTSEA